MMGSVQNAKHDRIAHIQIARGHVNFGSQGMRPLWKFSSAHALEQGKRARPMAEAGWRQVEKILKGS
jgi:hypothetical protein